MRGREREVRSIQRIQPVSVCAALCACLALTMSGCASQSTNGVGLAGSSAATSTPAAGGSAPSASPQSPVPPPASSPASSSSPASPPPPSPCQSGTVDLSWQAGQPPPAALCVRVGTKILIDLRGPLGYRWTPLTSSDPAVITVTPRTTDGVAAAVAATATAVSAGRAQVTATESFPADPHGPPTRLWTVAVTVVV